MTDFQSMRGDACQQWSVALSATPAQTDAARSACLASTSTSATDCIWTRSEGGAHGGVNSKSGASECLTCEPRCVGRRKTLTQPQYYIGKYVGHRNGTFVLPDSVSTATRLPPTATATPPPSPYRVHDIRCRIRGRSYSMQRSLLQAAQRRRRDQPRKYDGNFRLVWCYSPARLPDRDAESVRELGKMRLYVCIAD